MNFVLVNGRTPRPQSLCAFCCELIGESYLGGAAALPASVQQPAMPVIG